MASIKAAVAQEIVDSIIADVKKETEDINLRLVDMLDNSIREYRNDKENGVNARLDLLKEAREKEKVKIESELRYEVSQKLRDYRSDLFETFNQSLKAEVLAFLDSAAYARYIQDVVKKYAQSGDTLVLRSQDVALVDGDYTIREKAFEMGGIMIESDQIVHDFTLLSRYKDALQAFIAQSNVNI